MVRLYAAAFRFSQTTRLHLPEPVLGHADQRKFKTAHDRPGVAGELSQFKTVRVFCSGIPHPH